MTYYHGPYTRERLARATRTTQAINTFTAYLAWTITLSLAVTLIYTLGFIFN